MAISNIIPIIKREIDGKSVDTFINGKAKESIISPELLYLNEYYKFITPSNLIFQITENNKVLIKIQFEAGKKASTLNELEIDLPSLFHSTSPLHPVVAEGAKFMDLYFPIGKLTLLNDDKYKRLLISAMLLYSPITNVGVVTSLGDDLQRSKHVRESFRLNSDGKCFAIDGKGINIGVISDSYNTQKYTVFDPDTQINQNKPKAEIDVLNGDLPGKGNPNDYSKDVKIIKESMFQATDEGRAMLQIIHDVAPGAELFFHCASTLEEFKKAIEDLKDEKCGCSIIVDDLTFIEESFFAAKSEVSKAIEGFTSKPGNFFFSAAGNFGNYGHQGIFKSELQKQNTNFITSDEKDSDTVFRTYGDNIVLFQKVEFCKEGIYMIVLQWDDSDINERNFPDLDLYLVDDDGKLLTGNNRFNTSGDPMEYLAFIVKKSTSANILITCANGPTSKNLPYRYIVFRHNNGFSYDGMEKRKTPTVSGHAMLEQTITVGAVKKNCGHVPEIRNYSSYGGKLTNIPPTNIVIDIVAPDGENINLALIGKDTNNDHFQNFYGTSASAPHAVGAFALMMSSLNIANGGELLINNQGLQLNDLVLQLFKDTCTKLGSPEVAGAGLINSDKAFNLLLNQYQILENSIVNNDRNPCEKINDKPVLKIIAHDISCEYGQSWNLTYTIEGIPENEFNNLDLPNIKLNTTAVEPYPDVNNYTITPYFENQLTQDIIDLLPYKINFKPGVLSITKKDLVIRAKDDTFDKHRPINIEFVYQYNTNGIADNDHFLATIMQEHRSTFSETNMLVLINGFIDYGLNRDNFIRSDDVLYWLLETGSWMTLISKSTIDDLDQNLSNGNHIFEIDYNTFLDYLNFLKYEGDSNLFRPMSNNYRPLANNYRPLANNYRPLANNYRPLANNYRPLANNYRPLANTGSNDDDPVENPMHLILDDEFLQSSKEIKAYEYHSINLITGLNPGDDHYIFPGAFFAHMSINFNIEYRHGRYNIKRKSINK